MVDRLGGKMMPRIHATSNTMVKLKKIEALNISNDEKDMLFIVSQLAIGGKSYIMVLDDIIKVKKIYIERSFDELIQNKIYRINNKREEYIIYIAKKLKKYLENNNVVL